MKRKILLPAFLALVASVFIFSKAFVPDKSIKTVVRTQFENRTPNPDKVAMLEKLGFVNTDDYYIEKYSIERKFWTDKYNLSFIGDKEIEKFLKDNSFVLAPVQRYKADIPERSLEIINEAYTKLTDTTSKDSYSPYCKYLKTIDRSHIFLIISSDGVNWSSDYINPCIYIAAAIDKFDTEGMEVKKGILTPPPDPIAFMRVQNGYIEITNW